MSTSACALAPAPHDPLYAVCVGAGFLFCPEVIARWPKRRSDPAGIPAAACWRAMDTATPIGRAATGAVRKRSPGAGCTSPTSGSSTCGRRSCCASRSAASAPGTGGGSARRTWTTSSTTWATGLSFATVATSRASATAAIAARRREKCSKIAANQSAAVRRRGGRLGRSGASRERRAGLPCRPLPGVRKFPRGCQKPPALPRARFFPHGEFREAGAAEAQRGQKTAAETQRKRKGAAKMQREVPACSPLFDRGGHEFPPTPRPRIARGGECAGAPPVAEKATMHSRQRRCCREQKRSGDGLPRRWARCAGA